MNAKKFILENYELEESNFHSKTLAYMLMICNYYTFPDLLSCKNYTDVIEFETKFKEKISNFGIHQYSFINSKETGTNCIVVSNDSLVIIIFRGSEVEGGFFNSYKDWIKTDASTAMIRVDDFNKTYVHNGFYNAFKSVKDSLLIKLEEHKFTTKKVLITGHSLGGALAVIAAADLYTNTKIFSVYTYGEPKVGGEQFVNFYNQLKIPTFRYVNENDVVTMMPPSNKFLTKEFCPCYDYKDCGKYEHVGIPFYIVDSTIKNTPPLAKKKIIFKNTGSIERHDLGEYCRNIFNIYFSKNLHINLPLPPDSIIKHQ